MARKRPPLPLEWSEIRSDEGAVIGRYALRDGVIFVRHPDGWEKRTHASAGGANEGLARLILSEPPP
jgi:hypothetical protein